MPSRALDAELLFGEALYRIDGVSALFDAVWTGAECRACRLHDLCPDPIGPGPAKKRTRSSKSGIVLGKSKRFGR